MKKFLRDLLISQTVDYSGVSPEYDYDHFRRRFIVHSEAGTLIWKPKNLNDLGEFRNKYLNRIYELKQKKNEGKDVSKEMFAIYREIRKKYHPRYRANINVRLKGLRKWILSELQFKTS